MLVGFYVVLFIYFFATLMALQFNASIFYYYSVTLRSNHKRFEVQCLAGYPLTNFQLFMIKRFPLQMRQHIGLIFREKSFIILSILLVFKPNLVQRCTYVPF